DIVHATEGLRFMAYSTEVDSIRFYPEFKVKDREEDQKRYTMALATAMAILVSQLKQQWRLLKCGC
ncbi:hypothetical protein Tco_1330416, partial [Tanacetum coccineum]